MASKPFSVKTRKRVRITFTISAIVIITAMLLYLMLWINLTGPSYVVVQGNVAIDAPLTGYWPKPVTGQWLRYEGCFTPEELPGLVGIPISDIRNIRVDSNATYQFTLNTEEPLFFNQVVCSGVKCWINGKRVLSESGQTLNRAQYNALDNYSDGSGVYSVVIQIGNGSTKVYGYWGLLFGSRQQLMNQMNIQQLLDLSLVGMYLMMLILCLALFAQKTSERYLLLLATITVLSLIRWLPQIRFEPLISPGSLGIFNSDIFVFTRFLLFRQFIPLNYWKKLCPAAFIVSALWLLAYSINNIVWMCVFLCMYTIVEAVAICTGILANKSGNYVLAAGWCVNASIEFFYLLLNMGVLPQGMVDIFIRPMPHGRLICLIAFYIAVFGIFAKKFRLADDLMEQLDLRVQEKTAELLESNHQLEYAKVAKQNFMADIAHDLRNPLFAMGGYLDLLNKVTPTPTEQQKRYLERLDIKLQETTQMVNDLLYMARLEDGHVEFHFTQFYVRELLENAAADGRAKGFERGITIQIDTLRAPKYMTGDSFRLKEALDNLVSNALRYSPDGGVICLSARTEEGDKLSLSVKDQGAGMAPEAIAEIFERFSAGGERGENGLGLAISREIARKHKGDILVQSEPNAGTTVTLLLPMQL